MLIEWDCKTFSFVFFFYIYYLQKKLTNNNNNSILIYDFRNAQSKVYFPLILENSIQ